MKSLLVAASIALIALLTVPASAVAGGGGMAVGPHRHHATHHKTMRHHKHGLAYRAVHPRCFHKGRC